eukprot:jgi/Chlat1/3884/Chrsp26S04164
MRKRERENPCFVCGHYHRYEDGEPCGVCGHQPQPASSSKGSIASALPTEILPRFLFLGSFDHASRSDVLKALNITNIVNTVPSCQNLYRNSFKYYTCSEAKLLPLQEAIAAIEEIRISQQKVLVHCMSGVSRAPAVVIAYLIVHKGWRLPQAHQYIKELKPSTNITPEHAKQLQEFEEQQLGAPPPFAALGNAQPPPAVPAFGNSHLDRAGSTISFGAQISLPANQPFVFGAEHLQSNAATSSTNPLAAAQTGGSQHGNNMHF